MFVTLPIDAKMSKLSEISDFPESGPERPMKKNQKFGALRLKRTFKDEPWTTSRESSQ